MAVGLSDAILCILESIHVQKQMKQLIITAVNDKIDQFEFTRERKYKLTLHGISF